MESNPKQSISSLFTPSMITMMLMVIFVGLGEKLAERFLPVYLLAIGGTNFIVSALNGTDNFLSALYSFPGGYLSDKIGYKKALVVFNIMAMIGFSIVIIISTWWAVILGAVFFLSWTAISLPAIMDLVSTVVGKDRRAMGVSLHSLVRRIPMALGPIIGGAIIGYYGIVIGVRISFIIALFLAFIATIAEIYFIKEPPKKSKAPLRLRETLHNIRPELRTLLISDILIRFAEQIPYAFLAIWAMNYNGITSLQFGFLTAIEMTTALLIYIPVAYFADKTQRKKPFVAITFVFFTIFPTVLFFSHNFWMFIIAFIVRGLKEFGEPTRKALIMDLAPEDAKASTFGTYYLIRDIIVSIAAFSAAIFWNINPATNFFVATGFGVLGVVFFAVYGKDLKQIETETVEIEE
ncbi:MAG: MFS transporter [Candidatus Heimdallarchaeum endolithica]|uniref:MFS transporter n=1 Tax=Candidatus Heimdallarchaeum endolithica TaxID=2876572 RepID=A0A9Y1FRT7_9ARCH|nr:MAG: MFS transporter [Candidatus Heimdallarchaeum endolithica]